MHNFPSTVRLTKQSIYFLERIFDMEDKRFSIYQTMDVDNYSYTGVSDVVESALCNYSGVVFEDLEEAKAKYFDFMEEHCKQCAEASASDASENAKHERSE